MAKTNNLGDFLKDIADAIRTKKGTTAPINAQDMADEILSIKSDAPANSPIYGVSGLYQSDPLCTRTDDAVGMSYTINSSTGLIVSDFNTVFPWDEATIETIGNNEFLKMPDMWFRVGFDSSKRITDVAVSKEQGDIGNWYKVDSFYYGTNGGSLNGTKLESKPSVARLHTKTRAEFRTYATNNGSGYFQLDLYHNTVMKFLWLIEWATKNSDSITNGNTSGSPINTGGTNNITTPSGYIKPNKQMRWHYIEDFVGNYYEWVDGAVWDTNLYVTANPANYGDTSTNHTQFLTPISTTGTCLSALGWDENNPFLCYGIETVSNSSYNTYFCDFVRLTQNTDSVVFVGSSWYGSYPGDGMFACRYVPASSNGNSYGGRLLYKPTT